MRILYIFGFLITGVSFISGLAVSAERPVVAIFNFGIEDEFITSYVPEIQREFEREFIESKRYQIVSKKAIQDTLDAMGLKTCTDPILAAKIGKNLNANKVITGILEKSEELIVISLSLVDAENGKLEYENLFKLLENRAPSDIKYCAQFVMSKIPLTGHIVSVEGETIKIDLGLEHGLNEGDYAHAFEEGIEIRDLDGNLLGIERNIISTLEITDVYPSWSQAKIKRNFVKYILARGQTDVLIPGYRVDVQLDKETIEEALIALGIKKKGNAGRFLSFSRCSYNSHNNTLKQIYNQNPFYSIGIHFKSYKFFDFFLSSKGAVLNSKPSKSADKEAKLSMLTGSFGTRGKYRFDLPYDLSIVPYIGIGVNYSYLQEKIPTFKDIWYNAGYERFWGIELVYRHRIGIFLERLNSFNKFGPNDIDLGGMNTNIGISIWK